MNDTRPAKAVSNAVQGQEDVDQARRDEEPEANARREQLIARLRAVPDGFGLENTLEMTLDIIDRDIERRKTAGKG